MSTGKLKFFREDKGYGFVTDDETGQDFFVHASGIEEGIEKEDKVSFVIEEGPKGFKAVEVKKVTDSSQ